MRSDQQLGDAVIQSQAWRENAATKNAEVKINRLDLPSLERGKMSFSGGERNHLFLNSQGQTFSDISGVSGLDSDGDGRSFVVWDFDRDGRQDVALASISKPVLSLYRNQTAEAGDEHWKPGNVVAMKLVGGNKAPRASDTYSSRDAYGTKVSIQLAGQSLVRELRCGEGLAAQNSNCLLFGIGQEEAVDSIRVRWPSGKIQQFDNARAGELLTIYENESETEDRSGIVRSQYTVDQVPRKPNPRSQANDRPRLRSANSNAKVGLYISMATWCASCQSHLPQIRFLGSQYTAEQLSLVGVPVDEQDSNEKLTAYVEQHQPAYELTGPWEVEDRESYKQLIRQHFGSDLMPATIATDQNGQVIEILPGVPTASDIERMLRSMDSNTVEDSDP